MKKFIATLLVAAASLGTTAMAGDWYIGGTVGFMHESKRNITTNEFSLLPEVGYNFNDTWSFGGQIGYQYTNIAGASTNTNIFTISPYARWTYFRTSNNLVQLFVDGAVRLGLGSTSYRDNDSDTAVTWGIGLKPGIALNLNEHFSIVGHIGFLGYEGANNAAKDGGQSERGGVWVSGDDLTFGVYYTF